MVVSVGHLANKFSIVSNDHGYLQKYNFLENQCWEKVGRKNQNRQFKLKFEPQTKSDMQNSMVM